MLEQKWLKCEPCGCALAGFCQRHNLEKSTQEWIRCVKDSYYRHNLDSKILLTKAEYITTQDMIKDTLSLANKIVDCSYILGVSRSGLIPASVLATSLHLPIRSVNQYSLEISDLGGGSRFLPPKNGKYVYLVDDSSFTGRSTLELKNKLVSIVGSDIKTVSIYTSHLTKDKIDIYARMLSPWHLFEWNLYNSCYNNAYDIDGIICRDFTAEEDDDGDLYRKTMLEMETTSIQPKRRPVTFITARLEKYRDETERWLSQKGFGIKKLIMGPWSTKAEREQCNIPQWKSAELNKCEENIYIESCDFQARTMAHYTNKLIICPDSRMVYNA